MTNEEIVALLTRGYGRGAPSDHPVPLPCLCIGRGREACEIEAVARDEMRHLDWLADAIAS